MHGETVKFAAILVWCTHRVSCTVYYPYQQMHNTHILIHRTCDI